MVVPFERWAHTTIERCAGTTKSGNSSPYSLVDAFQDSNSDSTFPQYKEQLAVIDWEWRASGLYQFFYTAFPNMGRGDIHSPAYAI